MRRIFLSPIIFIPTPITDFMNRIFTFIVLVVCFSVASKALATVSEMQEQKADQICNANPASCGLYPETR